MRLFLILAVILSGVAFAAAVITSRTVLGMSTEGWIAASLVAFFLDLLLGGPDINSKKPTT